MNKTIGKTLSILLALALTLGMFAHAPPTAAAAIVTENLDFVSDSIPRVGEGWDWNGTDTLTLTDAYIRGYDAAGGNAYAIDLPAGSTIVLIGTNTVRGGDNTGGASAAIHCAGALTIEEGIGAGSLYATGGTATSSYGVYAGNVTIGGGIVTATGGTATSSYGVYTGNGDVGITGGTVTATGGSATNRSRGVAAGGGVSITGGTVTVTGGTVTDTAGTSYGILANSGVTITGGTVTATGGTASGTNGDSCGVCIFSGGINISGGLTIARGGNASSGSSWALSGHPTLTNVADLLDSSNTSHATGFAVYGLISVGYKVRTTALDNTTLNTISSLATDGWEWNSGTNTLTLYNLILVVPFDDAAITLPDGAKLVLQGVSVVRGGNIGLSSYGVRCSGSVTISGDGEIFAFGGTVTTGSSYGVCAQRGATITGGTVTATGGTATNSGSYGVHAYNGDMNITGGTVTATGGTGTSSYGVYAYDNNVEITGATVTATGGTATNLDSYGVRTFGDSGAANITIENATVTATGGTATTGSYGVRAFGNSGIANVTIENATVTATGGTAAGGSSGVSAYNSVGISNNAIVTATGGTATNGSSSGVYAYDNNVEITDATVTATGGTATNGTSADSYGVYAHGGVTISGATVTATGGMAGGDSCGVYARSGNVEIENATVTATGGTAGGDSCGVCVASDVSIKGSSTVTATGGTATGGSSYGVFAVSDVSIEGSATVTAMGGTVSSSTGSSFGVIAYSGGINITGGTVTATGGTAGGNSYGVYAYSGSVTIENAPVTAAGDTSAVNKPPDFGTISDWYKWKANDASATAPAGGYTLSGVLAYIYDADDLYLEIRPTGYIITLDANGGNVDPAYAATNADGVTLTLAHLPTPTLSGYTLKGWYTAASGGAAVTDSDVFTGDVTIYAQWTQNIGGLLNASVTPSAADYDLAAGGTLSAKLSPRSYELTKLTCGGVTLVQGADYTVSGNTFTFTEGFLSGLGVGEHKIIFGMSGGTDPVLTITVTEAPKPWDNPFEDIFEGDWYCGDVEYVHKNGLMIGTAETLFSPGAEVTRGMVVTILWRLEGSPSSSESAAFTDVPSGQWYSEAVAWAAEEGIVKGYGDGRFGTHDNITRQDLAVILMRYMNFQKISIPVTEQWIIFADEADIADYAMNAIQTFNKLGIINGTGKNESGQIIVNPKGNATRAETAAMLHRFIAAIEE